MVTKPEIRNRYPREIELDESVGTPGPSFMRVRPGGKPQIRPVPIRLMGATDRDSIVLFARHLPQEDLLFLHSDITQPAIVEEWELKVHHRVIFRAIMKLADLGIQRFVTFAL